MRNMMIVLVFGILLLGCVNPPPEANKTNVTNVTTPPLVNETVENTSVYVLPPDYMLQAGDYASVLYALWVNDELKDTNNATLANESGIYNPSKTYQPLNFVVDIGEGMITGFVINVVGLQINETIIFDVKPELGYGLYDQSKVAIVSRYYNKSLYETVPRSYFEENGLEVSNGTGYQSPYGQVFIDSFNDDNVTIFYLMQTGSKFTVNGIPQEVASVTNLTAKIEYGLDINRTYVLPHPETGAPTMFTVVEKTEQNITLDGNHPFANETLHFSVTLLDVIPVGAQ